MRQLPYQLGVCVNLKQSRSNPRAWSAALHRHSGNYDGIAYNARHDDEALCYAIFDRAADAIGEAERRSDLDAEWFWVIAEPYGVGLAP